MRKVLIDGGRLATSDKPLQHHIIRDSRHGRKRRLVADGSFSTAVDVMASRLLDPGIDDDVSSCTTPSPLANLVSSCRPNTMDLILQLSIRNVLRDAGRLGTSTKDAQLYIQSNSRRGRSPPRA